MSDLQRRQLIEALVGERRLLYLDNAAFFTRINHLADFITILVGALAIEAEIADDELQRQITAAAMGRERRGSE